MMLNLARRFAVALIAAAAAPLFVNSAAAEERSYYKGYPWEVVLVTPDDGGNKWPYCAMRSTSWPTKSVSIEYILEQQDVLTAAIRIKKQGWELPVGQETPISLQALLLIVRLDAASTGPEELYAKLPAGNIDLQVIELEMVMKALFAYPQGLPLTVNFQGDEESWTVAALEGMEMLQIRSAYEDCESDLKRMGPSLFAETNGAAAKTTSPFGKPKENPPQAKAGQAPELLQNQWRFRTQEEDWGQTCFAETQADNIKVGFMGAPGKDLVGFVEGVFTGEVNVTWGVDHNGSELAQGAEDDYFGWHSFYGLSEELLSATAKGKQLTIADLGLGKKRIMVDLQGAGEAISSFNGCFGKSKLTSDAETPSSAPNP